MKTKLIMKSALKRIIDQMEEFNKFTYELDLSIAGKKQLQGEKETIERNEELDKLQRRIRLLKQGVPEIKKDIDDFFKSTDKDAKKSCDDIFKNYTKRDGDSSKVPSREFEKTKMWCTRCGDDFYDHCSRDYGSSCTSSSCDCESFSSSQKLRYSRRMCEHTRITSNTLIAYCYNPNCHKELTDTDKGKKEIKISIEYNKKHDIENYNESIEQLIRQDYYLVKISIKENKGVTSLDLLEEYLPKKKKVAKK